MGKNINVSIDCRNVAPLTKLSANIQTSDLKLAIFAQNGSGKTYLSRMFRLLEGDKALYIDETGKVLTNYLLSFGTNQAVFGFCVEKDKHKFEDVKLEINRGKCFSLPSNIHYIYHTFNQDYVEQNIQSLDYVYDENGKNSSLQGYILGKAAIDIQEDKKKQEEIFTQGNAIKERIQQVIDEKKNTIKSFCGRLGAFSRINIDNIVLSGSKELGTIEKTTESYICDYDKIKSVPETFTVPYVSHLLDIYAVSKRLKTPSHTTSNSIRHILETLVKFSKIDLSDVSIDAYIEKNFEKNKDTYLFINDLSHGGWRSEQVPLTDDKYIQVCTEVIEHIKTLYPEQIEYCRKHLEK